MAPFRRIVGKIPPIDGRQRMGGGSDLDGALRLRRDSGQLIQRHGRRQHPPVLMIGMVAAQFGTAGRAEKTHLFPFPKLPGEAFQQLQVALPVRRRIIGNIKPAKCSITGSCVKCILPLDSRRHTCSSLIRPD